MRRVVSGLLLLAVGFFVGAGWRARTEAEAPVAEPRPVAPRTDLGSDEEATIELFRLAAPSVVYITSISLRSDFFRLNVQEIPSGTGSGFVWDDHGHVVTNYHVIQGAQRARVTLSDHTTWDAELVGVAPEKDLAVLRIEAPRETLEPLPVGSSHDLQVGQKVFAIGNPFGLDQTLTTGIISALGREIESVARIPLRDVIQTDAAINPGNSGGPLLDSGGRLIGVNTAIYSPSGASAGIGFAIPADTVNWVVPDLIAYRRLATPRLGVELAPDWWMRRMGLAGAMILRVESRSPAALAGLLGASRDAEGQLVLGDIVVAIEGRAIRSSDDLTRLVRSYKVGDRIELQVVRRGETSTLEIELTGSV